MDKKDGRWRRMNVYSWGDQGLQQAVAPRMNMIIIIYLLTL